MTPEVEVTREGSMIRWRCPRCSRLHYGMLGTEARGGWQDPVWVNTGTEDAPTLQPSLGCRGLLDGSCNGHFFCREGRLEEA